MYLLFSDILPIRISELHDFLLPVTSWCGCAFEYLVENGMLPSKVLPADIRHILLVLLFLLPDLKHPYAEE